MAPIVNEHRQQLAALSAKYRARKLEVFGSAASDRFDPERSDIDLLVEFEPMPPEDHADCYLGLLVALEDLFGRAIDLVEYRAIRNPYFRDAVDRSRATVYAA